MFANFSLRQAAIGAAALVLCGLMQPSSVSGQVYDPIRAAEDAQRYDEAAQRALIERQIAHQNAIRVYRPWAPYVNAYALPYVYRYGGARAGLRTQAAIERFAPRIEIYAPNVRGPRDFLTQPPEGEARQPIGHDRIWTGPNSYIYQPRYAEDAQGPTLAAPRVELPEPGGPELIPLPPAEDGPREF
jgi:hypothetical protein